MTYHISLSQDGRSYSLLMFLGMAGLYFFMKHLKHLKKDICFLVALFFSSYFIPAIAPSHSLSFPRSFGFIDQEEAKKPTFPPF